MKKRACGVITVSSLFLQLQTKVYLFALISVNLGKACSSHRLTYTTGLFVGDVQLYLLCKLGELYVKDLLRTLKENDTALT